MNDSVVNLSGVENLIPPIAQMLGIEPATALLAVGIIVTVANITGRLIPDTATGVLGGIRRVAKVVGLFVPNRVAPQITVNDVAKAVLTRKAGQLAGEVETEAREVIRDQLPRIGRD